MAGGLSRTHSLLRAFSLLAAALALSDLMSRPAEAQGPLNDYDSAFAAYHWADPLLDWPSKKLYQRIPALNGLEPAPDQVRVDDILERIGKNVEAFRKNFVNTTSTEIVEETRTKPDGSPDKRVQRQEFRYLMLAAPPGQDYLTEYRTDSSGREQAPRDPKPGFVKTSGFASLPLLLGPAHRPAYDLKYLGSQTIDGRRTEVIAFAGHPEPDAVSGQYLLFGKPIPLILQGVAWVDAGNFEIVRMHTDLLAPLAFAGLPRLTTEVTFGPISFRKGALTCWLPQVVDVTADFYGRTYHNRHTYSDYQLFSVESGEKEPVLKQGPETSQP